MCETPKMKGVTLIIPLSFSKEKGGTYQLQIGIIPHRIICPSSHLPFWFKDKGEQKTEDDGGGNPGAG